MLEIKAITTDDVTVDNSMMDGSMMDGPMGMTEGTKSNDPLLSKPVYVFGISAITVMVSIVLGILLAKKRIKKGIELYED